MEAVYLSPGEPGSFGGISALSRYSKVKNLKRVADWLAGQDAYTLHKPVRRKFARRKTFALGSGHLYQADLVDMTNVSAHNDGYRFILTCVDCFSRYAWCRTLKNKSSQSVTVAFASVLEERVLHKPTYLQCDRGKEFYNSLFQTYLKENGITLYSTENYEIKAIVVERFNRTLKSRMYHYFTSVGTKRYVDVLPDLVRAYNGTYHSSIGTAPALVNASNQKLIRQRLYGSEKKSGGGKKFASGDVVRISENKRLFKKGYTGSWTERIV